MDPVGKKISHAIRKRNPIIFLKGYDSNLRIVEFEPGLTGYLHENDAGIDLIPDGRGMLKFYGTSAGFGSSETVSNFNTKFEQYVSAWREKQMNGELTKLEDATGRKLGASAQDLAMAMWDLQRKRQQAKQDLEDYEKWKANQTTLAEIAHAKGLTELEAKKFILEKEQLAKDDAETLKARIRYLDEAAEIVTHEQWEAQMRLGPNGEPKYSLARVVRHTLDDLWTFIPTSANMLSVRTMVNRAVEMRAKEMSQFEKALMRYIGPVLLILALCIGGGVLYTLVK